MGRANRLMIIDKIAEIMNLGSFKGQVSQLFQANTMGISGVPLARQPWDLVASLWWFETLLLLLLLLLLLPPSSPSSAKSEITEQFMRIFKKYAPPTELEVLHIVPFS